MKADAKLIQRMKTLSKKRNATSYDSAGNVSNQELELAIKTAIELRRNVVAWLEQNYPDLLKN
jgi:predicted Rossmann fold nucleotide-binding protein DprA/Smf involved in DNA uptake